jgi:L-malate glycosyltransferase
MDARRLTAELSLTATRAEPTPDGHGGHPITDLVLALAPSVERLDLVTLDPRLTAPVVLTGDGVRLAVGPFRPRARTRSLDLFAVERRFIADRLVQWQPEAVSAHWTYEYALGAIRAGLPTLTTVHDWAPTILRHARDPYRLVRLAMQAAVFARGHHFAAVSPYMARKVEFATRTRVAVLPNGLGPQWSQPPVPDPNGTRVIAINDGFGRRKNVQRLLEAWPAVRHVHAQAELLLVGSGYEVSGAAHHWAEERGLTSGVRFVGPVDRSELPHLLAGSRLLAHPALEESFGMVLLEAMSVGIPVLGGRDSGAVPWVLDAGAGVLVDVRDPTEIASGIVRLLSDPGLAERTAARGRARARDRFSITVTSRSYLDCLASVASASGRG